MLQNTTVAARPLKLIRVGAVRYESLAVLILLALVMSFLSPYFLGSTTSSTFSLRPR
jgi:hypothetical protein